MIRKTALVLLLLIFVCIPAMPVSADSYSCSMFPVVSQDVLDDDKKMEEPSGIAYHPARKTMFVVSDDDFVYETDLDMTIIRSSKITLADTRKLDLEGVAVNTRTGSVYLLSEELDSVLEMNPDTFAITGVYCYPEKFGKKQIFIKGAEGNGPEGLAFMPGKKPEEDVIFICNQDDPPNLIKMKAPIQSKTRNLMPVKLTIISVVSLPAKDLSAATYCAARNTMFVVSDFNNIAFELTRDGQILRIWAMPGDEQEGIAFVNDYMYIAQDTGKILRCKLNRIFFRKADKK